MITVALSIMNSATREHFQGLLANASLEPAWLKSAEVIDLSCDQEELTRVLKNYFQEEPGRMVVLISDWLASSARRSKESRLATQYQSEFRKEAFGTLAIMPEPERLADIDRTISPDCTRAILENKLNLIVGRLLYLLPPARPSRTDSPVITVRRLRTANEMEFRDYFRLRHLVYTTMGYLDDEVENTRSSLEVNAADLHAIHLGAFRRDGAQQKLVGTARVVTTDEADDALQTLFEEMVHLDPVARKRLDTPYPLGLPIFQSHRAMNKTIFETYIRNQICGELSRVIVAPEFRGFGISSRLIEEALRTSRDRGVQWLFLECLPIHERLYEQHGFRRICGVEGQVVEVGRTMITMELRLNGIATVPVAFSESAAAGAT